MIKIVKINKPQNNFTLYCGRDWAGLKCSEFHNPFHVGKDGDREEVLLKFAEYWYAPEQKWLRLFALLVISDDEILGCWCKPKECHCDIIAGYVHWKRNLWKMIGVPPLFL